MTLDEFNKFLVHSMAGYEPTREGMDKRRELKEELNQMILSNSEVNVNAIKL